ncbi:MAG: transposase, partial [Candidatus Angelobacter sp.]
MELEANFATGAACRTYLARLRWPAGFRCPRCGSEKAWPVRGLWERGGCGCQTSVTEAQSTNCRGYLSQGHTHLKEI